MNWAKHLFSNPETQDKPTPASSSTGPTRLPIPIAMIWDVESLPTRSGPGFEDTTLVARLNRSLKRLNDRYVLRHIFVCANDKEGFTRRVRNIETPECKVHFERAPKMWLRCFHCLADFRPSKERSYHHLTRVKEIADRILLGKMQSHADEEGRGSAVLVATADKDFMYATRDLREDGFTILAVVMDGRPSPVAQESCSYWYWDEMQRGVGEATTVPTKTALPRPSSSALLCILPNNILSAISFTLVR